MKNIVFTICSNNYLSQAKVLSDSVYEYSKETYDFYIVLCDVKNKSINYDEFHATFVEAKELNIENFSWMQKHYNIIELNTAIKPFAFQYLYKVSDAEYIHYLDPDTCTYQSLKAIEDEMAPVYSILLTPHSLSPIPDDGKTPTENVFLNNGIYNLGFLGTKRSTDTFEMLEWWSSFLAEKCFISTHNGLFVDQLPMELVPLYFNNVKVSRHKGLNAAYWNLHDRTIRYDHGKGQFFASDDILVFFHFSSYRMKNPNILSSHCTRYSLKDATLKLLFDDYFKEMSSTKYQLYASITSVYNKRQGLWRSFLRRVSNKIARETRRIADNIMYS